MEWVDALKVSTLVIASLGGGGVIVLGLARFLGDKWLQDWKGDIDARLQRLDAALKHRNYLLQRIAEFELEAITGMLAGGTGLPAPDQRDEAARQRNGREPLTSSRQGSRRRTRQAH